MGYWHMAFLGEGSFWAAEASECAADQDKFWEYHDLLFDNLASGNGGAKTKESLKALAKQLGLNEQTFNQCLDSGKYTEYVQTQTTTAQRIGVSSTPAFLINGQPIMGAQPFDAFQQIIEAALVGSGEGSGTP